VPSWKEVQEGRPKPAKPASQTSLGATAHLTKFKKVPSTSSLGLERNLPFVVGQVIIRGLIRDDWNSFVEQSEHW
jgi:hypothetical protein